jgi:hypothetical protein
LQKACTPTARSRTVTMLRLRHHLLIATQMNDKKLSVVNDVSTSLTYAVKHYKKVRKVVNPLYTSRPFPQKWSGVFEYTKNSPLLI